ncbi:MAG: hypothetical protein WCD18_18410 [Thermosynechococcaceae cyanobacterium]
MPRKSPNYAPSDSVIRQPDEGKLVPLIDAFISTYRAELHPSDDIDQYMRMVTTCPPLKTAVKVAILIALTFLGEYTHEEPAIASFVNAVFAGMRGSLKGSVADLLSCIYVGYAASEISMKSMADRWVLDGIDILPPNLWRFRGTLGQIDDLYYVGQIEIIEIPYDRVLHLVNNPEFSFGQPYGISDFRSARAAYEAWLLVMAEFLVACHRDATPLLVGYADQTAPAVPMFDTLGQPVLNPDATQKVVTPSQELAQSLGKVDNKTSLITSTRNKIDAIARSDGHQVLFDGLRYLHKLMYLSVFMPETALEVVGTSGDSNLAKSQQQLMLVNYKSLMERVKDLLIDRLLKPLIIYNFGVQTDYGMFDTPVQDEGDRLALAQILMDAVETGFFKRDDLSVINRVSSLLGLPHVEADPTMLR